MAAPIVRDVDLLEGEDGMVEDEMIASHAHADGSMHAERSVGSHDAASGAAPVHAADARFDAIVSAIEDAIMNPDFKTHVDAWCASHCDVFDYSEENKLEYTPLFDEYTCMLEGALQRAITHAIGPFDMSELEHFLTTRADEMSGDIFDLLVSLGDFNEFKALMCAHKDEKAATASSAAAGLRVTVTPLKPRPQADGGAEL